MSEESYVETHDGWTTFSGPDATLLFAAMTLRSAISLYLKVGVQVNRAYTPAAMRGTVTRITGRQYARSKAGLSVALIDLTTWIEAMQAAMPVVEGE